MLRANRLDANSVAVFVGQTGKHKIALRAAEVVGAQWGVIEREWLGRRNRLWAVSVSHRDPFIAPNVIVGIDGPFAATSPLQLVAPQRYAKLQAYFERPQVRSGVDEVVTHSD